MKLNFFICAPNDFTETSFPLCLLTPLLCFVFLCCSGSLGTEKINIQCRCTHFCWLVLLLSGQPFNKTLHGVFASAICAMPSRLRCQWRLARFASMTVDRPRYQQSLIKRYIRSFCFRKASQEKHVKMHLRAE